jgi:hypothetical protein
LVEPPVAMMSATAFSIDLRVTMSRGLQVLLDGLDQHLGRLVGRLSACRRRGWPCVDEPSRLMPSASKDEDMVLAVYMPPQEPRAGHGVALDAVEVLLAHLARGEFAHGLEHATRWSGPCPSRCPA